MTNHPDITFFCELSIEALERLFNNPSLVKKLRLLDANISMGLLDFSPERAKIIKKLTKAGIPVTAWLLLPKEQGYWTNLDTVAATTRIYGEFKKWTAKNDLQWAAVGLDIEPSYDRKGLFGSDWKNQLPELVIRLFNINHYRLALSDLRTLINLIRTDGYPVETYNFPVVVEERKASSEIISRVLGTPPLDSDREILMLYSSFFDRNGDAVLWSYARQAEGIGLGSTGGGVELENGEPLPSLRWIDLRRDLLIAKQFSKYLYVFSLEGCVQNDYLDRIIDLDWDAKIQMPREEITKINLLRNLLAGLLWILSHPLVILLPGLLFLIPARRGNIKILKRETPG